MTTVEPFGHILCLLSITLFNCSLNFLHVYTHFNTSVKIVRTNNDTEFFNIKMNDLVGSHRMIHQSSCINTPQQNGKVERKHRALRFQSSLPIHFWGERLLTASYIINRLSHSYIRLQNTLWKVFPFSSFLYTHESIWLSVLCISTFI